MKIVKEDQAPNKPKSSKSSVFDDEFRRKWRLEFVAVHNKKIQKMKDDGTYDKWLNKN